MKCCCILIYMKQYRRSHLWSQRIIRATGLLEPWQRQFLYVLPRQNPVDSPPLHIPNDMIPFLNVVFHHCQKMDKWQVRDNERGADPSLPFLDPVALTPAETVTGCHGEVLANVACQWQAFEPRSKRCNYHHSVGVQWTEDGLQTTRLWSSESKQHALGNLNNNRR